MILDLFNAVLTMSLTATVAALVVFALRVLLKKLSAPKLVVFLLWAVVLFRMVCPASFESPISLLGTIPRAPATVQIVNSPPLNADDAKRLSPFISSYHGMEGVPAPQPPQFPQGATPYTAVRSIFVPMEALAWVWAAGMLALCAYGAISYLRLKSKVRVAVKTEDGAWETDRIDSPFVLGFFPPKIYLPPGLVEEGRQYVLLHERAHVRRVDYIVKAVAFLALTVHWFNPVLWLAWVLACRDMEAACDEAVLKGSVDDIRRSYSSALLSLASVRPVRVPLAFGENDIKGRIKGVLKYKRPVVTMVLASALLVVIAGFALAANPMPLPGEPGELTVELTNLDGFSLTPARTHWDGKDYAVTPDWAAAPIRTEIGSSVDFSITGPVPDEIAVSDYLLTEDVFSSPNPVRVSPYGNNNGHYLLPIQAHPGSTGVEAEERGLLITARWNSGVSYQECQYFFRLLVPARREGQPTPAPVAFAGGQVLPLYEADDFASLPAEGVVAATGSYVEVFHPNGITSEDLSIHSLTDNAYLSGHGSSIKDGSNPDTNIHFGGGASSLPEEAGSVGVRLTYTYPDGSQKTWQGRIEVK